VTDLLPLYFRDVNISRGAVAHRQKLGEIAPLGRGVYIGTPFTADEMRAAPQVVASRINQTLRHFAPRLAAHIYPGAPLVYASAYRQSAGEHGRVYLLGARASEVVVGDALRGVLPEAVTRLVNPVAIEVRRGRPDTLDIRPERDYRDVALEDGLLDVPGVLQYSLRGERSTESLRVQKLRVTTPRRTVLDLVRLPAGDKAGLETQEFQALLQLAGLPHHGNLAEERIKQALAALRNEFPTYPSTGIRGLQSVLQDLAQQEGLRPQIEHSLKQAVDEFSLRWFGTPIARVIRRRDDQWVFHYEDGWQLRAWPEESNRGFPAFLSNLFPEIRTFQPHERAEFLRKYARLMSNLTVVDAREFGRHIGEDRLRFPLKAMADDPVTYRGRVSGLPVFDADFLERVRQIMNSRAMTQVSGCQLKVPMTLDADGARPALNQPFTHILKVPLNQDLRLLGALEWYSMSLAREAGVEVPDFRMIDLGAVESGSFEPGAYQGGDAPPSMGETLAEAVAVDMATVRPATPEEVIGRLSDSIADVTALNKALWSEVFKLAGGDDALFPAEPARNWCDIPPAFLIERFDIPTPHDPRWRLAEDFCSLTNRVAVDGDVKYQGTMEEVAQTLKRHSTHWEDDRVRLFRQVALNVLVGNSDAHLKNFSILRIAAHGKDRFDSVRLSPAYDIVSAAVLYAGEQNQSLPLYGDRRPGRKSLLRFAEMACEISPSEAAAVLDQLRTRLLQQADVVLSQVPDYVAREPAYMRAIETANRYVKSMCMRLRPDGPALAGAGL